MLTFFDQLSGVTAVMSEREDGSMKLFTGNDENIAHRERFFQQVCTTTDKIVAAEIVHGATAQLVHKESQEYIPQVDALITKDTQVMLSVTIADCIPVFFYESEVKLIGIAHCGWRGIVAGIINNTVMKLLEAGAKVENLHVALGPGINQCHFEIGDDVLHQFADFSDFVSRSDGKIFVDLKGIIRRQLDNCGVHSEAIEENSDCTVEDEQKYFSFRRDKPPKVQAMVAMIGMQKP